MKKSKNVKGVEILASLSEKVMLKKTPECIWEASHAKAWRNAALSISGKSK